MQFHIPQNASEEETRQIMESANSILQAYYKRWEESEKADILKDRIGADKTHEKLRGGQMPELEPGILELFDKSWDKQNTTEIG